MTMDEDQTRRLRDLAVWYREFAERTGDPVIWDARLRTAEDLEREAEAVERAAAQQAVGRPPPDRHRRPPALVARAAPQPRREVEHPGVRAS
jgi:hypothetical protein